MDATTAHLVDYALQTEFSHLPADTVHECKRRIIDTFACAVGAYEDPLCRMARAVASRCTGTPSASVWGCTHPTTPEAAAFANGVMLRVDDINDVYPAKSGGHPSDVISGLVAVGEAVQADGRSLIAAITVAYDVFASLNEIFDLNSKGWDQTINAVLAGVLGAGKLLHLSREQMGHAVSLALVPNMALFATRAGDLALSDWKGCAAANAARNAVFAAFLARDGFTGPAAVFEGRHGLWDVVGEFDWKIVVGPDNPHRVTRTHLKCYPMCAHGLPVTQAALDLRDRVRVGDIAAIRIEIYRRAVDFMANDASRWAPTTRETADHSIPYITAVALLDGEVMPRSYAPEKLADPTIVALMKRVEVVENPAYTKQFPQAWPVRMHVQHTQGDSVTTEVLHPKGNVMNPLSDEELGDKFRRMFRGFGDETQCLGTLNALWAIEQAGDIGSIVRLFQKSP